MKPIRTIILIIIFAVLLSGSLLSQSVNLPLNHWAYNFLERLETKNAFNSLALRTRPISRNDAAKILVEISDNIKEKKLKLSRTERDKFEQLKGEFHEELFKLNKRAKKMYHERHLLQWKENNSHFKVDVDFSQRFEIGRGDQLDSTARTSRTTGGAIIRGNLNNSLAFFLHFKNTLVRGETHERENFNPEFGKPTVIAGKNVYQDEASAYFVWRLPWFDFEFGRDQAQWGPGCQGSLMLSANNPLFDMFKIRANYKRFHFTSIHGRLNSSVGRKFYAAHRLEFQPFPWLQLAGSEAVVYGNRDAELQYINPIMPYHIAEHHLGDKDNNTLGFDATLFPLKGHKIYTEIFLDDFTSTENPFTYFGNKFAFMVGHFWVNPLGIPNLGLRLEYTRIEPFVYTHHDSINVYQNYNQIIGHWLGPNSDQFYFETEWLVNRDLNIKFLTERVRHGEGDVSSPHAKADGIKKSFLSGTVEKRWRFGISITDQIIRDIFLTFQYHFIDTKNLGKIEGINSRDNQIVVQLSGNW